MPNPENKPTIAVDVDDVAGAENEALRLFANREYGFSHTPEDYLVEGEYWGYWERLWPVDPDKAKEIYQAFLRSPDKADLKPVEGAIEGIERLKKDYNLVVVTSRDGPAMEITKPWLEKHFPDTFRRVEFVVTWSEHPNISKAIICKQIGADYLIDDNAEHCNLAAEEGIKALLFGNYGWSRRAALREGVTRVNDWQEVLEYFNEQGRR